MSQLVFRACLAAMFLQGCTVISPKIGLENGQLKPCPNSPNCVNSLATTNQHFVEPINFEGSQQEASNQLVKILNTMPEANITKQQPSYVAAEFISRLFGFVDDVEFQMSITDVGETIINVRSASRVGYTDFGTNRKRIEMLRAQFNQD
jgi:uncharacterized protein (DUF1499 family)